MKRITAPAAVLLILLALYVWTLAPGNFWVDSAAFTTCNEILGLPHAPSFPLYTITGRVIHTILPVNPAIASNIYSALTSAFGGVVLYYLLLLLIQKLVVGVKHIRLTAGCGTIFAFLTLPVWQSSVRAEVYSLQILLMLIVMYTSLKVLLADKNTDYRFQLIAAFTQGLAFANHSLIALLTVPLVGIVLFSGLRSRPIRARIKNLAIASVLFFLALSLYLYLPVRANQDPQVNSGQPKTIQQAYNSITRSGEDYLPQNAIPQADYFDRFKNLSIFVFDQTGGLIIVGCIFAIFLAVKRRNRTVYYLFGTSLTGFAVTVWAADFRLYNFDIVAYAAIPLVLLIALAFLGLYYAVQRLRDKPHIARYAPLIFILMAFFEFYGNLYAADLSATSGPDVLAESILQHAPANAIVIVNEDDIVLPLWYHCYALGKRPDIAIISAGALYRPDYRRQVRQNYPNLIYPESFKNRIIKDLPSSLIEFYGANGNRPIQVQFGTPGFNVEKLYPDGFLFRYTEQGIESRPQADEIAHIYEAVAGTATDLLTKEFLGRNSFNTGIYFEHLGMPDEAYLFFQYAIEIDDNNPDYLLRLGIAFLDAGRTDDAVALLIQATETGNGCPEAEKILERLEARKFGEL